MRETSKIDWDHQDNNAAIQLGCLQRIADASEKMAANYSSLLGDNDFLRARVNLLRGQVDTLRRSNAALRGYVRRLKTGGAK